jgi:two-component system, OmpR family, sensor histidine kinase CiaH
MFESARLKLTLWYLFLIMVVSAVFSAVIFGIVSNQIDGFIRMQNERVSRFESGPRVSPLIPEGPPPNPSPYIDTQTLREQEKKLLLTLLATNAGLLFIAGGAGYFLAGRTLTPIKRMVDEQNQFIGNASHELRTPLTVLRAEMEASLLEKHISDVDSRKLIASNVEEVERLQILINNLLKLATVRSGIFKDAKEHIQLKEVIDSAEKKIVSLAKQKNISVIKKQIEGTVTGDKGSLTELCIILLDNAIKYSASHSSITIISGKFKNMVRLQIIDEGIGIPHKDLPHIFDRFYRADPSRSLTDGYGLGLSIAKNIVEAHNGTIWAESDGKKGTTFSVEFPIV